MKNINAFYRYLISQVLVVLLTLAPGGIFLNFDTTAHATQVTEYSPQGLSSTGWTITDDTSNASLTNLTDNNPSTYSTLSYNSSTGTTGFDINLGASTVVDRVYLTGPTTGDGQNNANAAPINGNPANWDPSGVSLAVTASSGAITAVSVASGQSVSGYVAGEWLQVGNGTNGIAKITSVDSSGSITGLSIVSAGSGYTTATSDAAQLFPQGMITVYAGSTANPTTQVAQSLLPPDAGNPVDTEADLRFQPVAAKYIRVVIQTAGINWSNYFYGATTNSTAVPLTWNVGEVEVHGFAGQSSIIPKDAVVLPTAAAAAYAAGPTGSNYSLYLPLILAAQDLSYYLGKLEGNPVPIVTAAQESSYPGTIYAIEDLKSDAPNYATMIANEKSGLLPPDISVVQSGNQVQFSGWPYRNVLKSVWTFLADQGTHWVYPSPHGDYIPVTGSVNVSMLPLSASSIGSTPKSVYANWSMWYFLPYLPWNGQNLRQGLPSNFPK